MKGKCAPPTAPGHWVRILNKNHTPFSRQLLKSFLYSNSMHGDLKTKSKSISQQFKTSAFDTFSKAFMSWNGFFFSSVNGSWSQWSSWQPCSVTCGEGNRVRFRTCSNPAPKWNGMDCPGTNISTESCNLHECKGRS